MENKITIAETLDLIAAVAVGTEHEEVILAYVEKEKDKAAKKAAKAKERKEEKRAAGDELRDAVESIIANAENPLTSADILACFDNAEELELTEAKVRNRASELVRYNKVHKTEVVVEGEDGKKKTRVGYIYGPEAE